VHRPDDFDLQTEVRPPVFTPDEMGPPAPVAPKNMGARSHAATLRSAGTKPEFGAALAASAPNDKTIPMQGAPVPLPPAPAPTAPLPAPTAPLPAPTAPLPAPVVQSPGPIAQPAAPSSVPSPGSPVLPPAPPRPLAPPRLDARGIVLIAVGGLLSMLVAAVLAWIVVRALSE
jgi:hypothetical protein